MKPRCAAPDALSVLPLLHGLDRPQSIFETVRDWPSQVALDFSEEKHNTRVAFISPVDYARYGGLYRVVPGIAVSVPEPSDVAILRVRPDARYIHTLAADPRSASDIVLASIIIAEKFPDADGGKKNATILPALDPSTVSFDRCDAVLEYHPYPYRSEPEGFALDLYEEWKDLTGCSHVLGFWVLRDGDGSPEWMEALKSASIDGPRLRKEIAEDEARRTSASVEQYTHQIGAFNYELTAEQEESIHELFQFAFYHGIIGDVPELRYVESSG